jgi:hypothetical protein
MYLQEFPPCHTFDVLEPGHDLAPEKRLSIETRERMDHVHIVFCVTEPVKQSKTFSQQRACPAKSAAASSNASSRLAFASYWVRMAPLGSGELSAISPVR